MTCLSGVAGHAVRPVLLGASFLAAISLLLPRQVIAADPEAAKIHFMNGKSLVESGSLDEAVLEFKKSYESNALPLVLYNIALCYDELHKYALATAYYAQYLEKDTSLSTGKIEEISGRIEEISEFLGTLKLQVDEVGAEIVIDGDKVGTTPTVGIFLDVGEHDLLLRKTGLPDFKKIFKIYAGEVTEIKVPTPGSQPVSATVPPVPEVVTAKPVVSSPSSSNEAGKQKIGKAPFAITAGLTGAALVTAIVTGALALQAEDAFHEQYYEQEDKWRPLKERADKLGTTTDAMIGIGSVAAAATVVIAIFTDFGSEKKQNVSGSPFHVALGSGIAVEVEF